MSQFGDFFLTNAGANLLSKLHTGGTLAFTRVGIGDGEWANGGVNDPTLTDLYSEKISLDIQSVTAVGSGKARISSVLLYSGLLSSGFYSKEIGLFATDPDEGEILFGAAYAGELADWVPSSSEVPSYEHVYNLSVAIGNATTVTASIDPNIMTATLQDLETHENKQLDTTDTDTVKERHLSNAQGKKWEDHVGETVNDSPHGISVLLAPIYPEVLTSNAQLVITNNENGTITIDAGQSWVHRGLVEYSSDGYSAGERTLAHSASKTYHVRWNPTDGFMIKDLADAGYNPSTLAEADISFDSGYDDMLIARVVTDGSNIPTLTLLANSNRLLAEFASSGVAQIVGADLSANYESTFTIDWARQPKTLPVYAVVYQSGAEALSGGANYYRELTVDRYTIYVWIQSDWNTSPTTPHGAIEVQALA